MVFIISVGRSVIVNMGIIIVGVIPMIIMTVIVITMSVAMSIISMIVAVAVAVFLMMPRTMPVINISDSDKQY